VAGGSAAVFPRHGRLPGCGHADDPGWRLSPARIQVLGACGIWIVLAWVPAAGPLRRDRPSAAPSGWRTPCGMYLRTEVPASWRSGRPCRRQMRAFTAAG